MDLRINSGYIINDSVHVGNTEFVLGVSSKAPAQFVTWECKDGKDYYWGHYTDTRFKAEKDLCERAMQEIRILEQRQPKPENADKKPKDKECER